MKGPAKAGPFLSSTLLFEAVAVFGHASLGNGFSFDPDLVVSVDPKIRLFV